MAKNRKKKKRYCSCSKMLHKKGAPKNYAIATGKHLHLDVPAIKLKA